MTRPKPRAPSAAKTYARRSTSPPAPPSRRTRAAAVTDSTARNRPLVADASQLTDLLDAHIDRLHDVRAVLWAIAAALQRTATDTPPPRTLLFELQRLATAGLTFANDFIDTMTDERDCLNQCTAPALATPSSPPAAQPH
jgi:hypothetical protein